MKQRLSILYSDNKPWFYLVENIAAAVLLVIFVLLVNTQTLPLMDYVPVFFLTKMAPAQSILSTLAGALLTITTFTFSIAMVVLTTYSSDYSPRVVENFLHKKTTMKVLGTFVGGFVYCIVALFFLDETFTSQRVVSASVGILYAFWCVIQFIIFIFSVANSVQVQNLTAELYDEAQSIIDDFIKADDGK